MIIENAREQKDAGFLSAMLGAGAVVISATMVFAQLQTAMNRIWNVEPKPRGNAIFAWLRKRLLSLSMMAGIGFLMLVSLAISAALNLIFTGEGTLWKVIDLGVSLGIYTLLFAMIFKVLPDVEIQWRDVWGGAFITAILFDVGKFAIGKYLGYSSVGSAYGAAGSLVVLLVWVYYSSLVVFMGAEITQVMSQRRGDRNPEQFAVEGHPEKGAVDSPRPSSDM
jgi:membrane protein